LGQEATDFNGEAALLNLHWRGRMQSTTSTAVSAVTGRRTPDVHRHPIASRHRFRAFVGIRLIDAKRSFIVRDVQ